MFPQTLEYEWQYLPENVFGDCMMMIGLESLDTFDDCRHVCKRWSEMIVRYSDLLFYFQNGCSKLDWRNVTPF